MSLCKSFYGHMFLFILNKYLGIPSGLGLWFLGFPGGSLGKESVCNVGDTGFDPWVGKIRWRRKWQPTSVFLPGESHGQRILVGYSP